MRRRSMLIRLVIFAAVVAVAAIAVREAGFEELLEPEALRARVDELGWRGVLLLLGGWMVLGTLAGQTFLPTMAGAVAYGWVAGGFIAVLGMALSGTAQFLGFRFLLRDVAQTLVLSRFPALTKSMEERGLGLLVMLRFIWFPNLLLNGSTALTAMPLRSFVVAFPAALPQALLLCLVADSLYTWGWAGIPTGRWVLIGSLLGGGIVTYVFAMVKFPALRAFTRRPVEEAVAPVLED